MITVMFYGGLREYGRRFDLHVHTPAEAIRALLTQIKGLQQYIRDGVYQVRFNRQDYSEDTIHESFRQPASGILHIVPRVAGAGKNGGIIQTIVGVVMIVVGALTSWAGGGALVAVGISMVMGGVAQMLTKQPKLDSGGGGVESSKNTAFSNLTNTDAQGQPVPLAYGLSYNGSRRVSQGIESRRIKTGGTAAETANSVMRMVAQAAGAKPGAGDADPLAVDLSIDMQKIYTDGVAATAPNGEKYNTDFGNDSVRARNYVAAYMV